MPFTWTNFGMLNKWPIISVSLTITAIVLGVEAISCQLNCYKTMIGSFLGFVSHQQFNFTINRTLYFKCVKTHPGEVLIAFNLKNSTQSPYKTGLPVNIFLTIPFINVWIVFVYPFMCLLWLFLCYKLKCHSLRFICSAFLWLLFLLIYSIYQTFINLEMSQIFFSTLEFSSSGNQERAGG